MNDMQGTIRVTRREGGYRDRARAYKVLLDGQEIGKIKHGESCERQVAPGAHSLRIKIDWTGSDTETVDVAAGDVVDYTCEPNGNVFNLFWQILTPNKWIRLTRST